MGAALSEVDNDSSAEHEAGLPAVPQEDGRDAEHLREQSGRDRGGLGALGVRHDGVRGDDSGGSGKQDEPTNTATGAAAAAAAAAAAVLCHCSDDDLPVGLLARMVFVAD